MKPLPSAQQLRRGEPRAFETLLLALKDLQDTVPTIEALKDAGIVGQDSRGTLYDPEDDADTGFDGTDDTKPDAPTSLALKLTSANLAYITWVVPPFQPVLSHSEVWELPAPAFRADVDYVVGDFVTYASTTYKFTTAHTAAPWDATDVTAATAGDLVIGNAKTRHQASVASALIPLDIGGTSYFWVRLVSATGIAGLFSASAALEAESKGLQGEFPVGGELASQASPGAKYLELAGQTGLLRADYPELFAWANTAAVVFVEGAKLVAQYGDGNGTTTFSLPDYRGRTLVAQSAAGTFATIGTATGAETITLATAEIPSHTHTQDAHNHTQDAHNHTQDAHTHTQDAHTHVQDAHSHGQRVFNGGTPGTAGAQGADTANDTTAGTTAVATATNQNATAVNQNATATNQAATATNQAATATNQNTGGGGAHNNIQPSAVTRWWVRALA